MNKVNAIATILLIICIFPYEAFATAPPPVPIDGGLSLLVAAGIGYGVKKVRDERRKRKEDLNK